MISKDQGQWPPKVSKRQLKLIRQHSKVCRKFRKATGPYATEPFRCAGDTCPLFIPETCSCGFGCRAYAHIKAE